MSKIQAWNKEYPETKVEYAKVNLASLHSVHDFATQFKSRGLPLHILINNAGAMGFEGLTMDGIVTVTCASNVVGFEYSFGVNYLGHYLLTSMLHCVVATNSL